MINNIKNFIIELVYAISLCFIFSYIINVFLVLPFWIDIILLIFFVLPIYHSTVDRLKVVEI